MRIQLPGSRSTGPLSRKLPRSSLALGLDVLDGDRRRRLFSEKRILVCGDLAIGIRRTLTSAGAKLTQVETVADAVVRLATDGFDVVLLEPGNDGAHLSLAKALKFGANIDEVEEKILVHARAKHRMTPLFVLPLLGESEYAIIVFPPELSFMEDGLELPLVTAVLNLDLPKLLSGRAGALA